MQIKLTFLGAAQNVTGSRYLIEVNSTRILVDCGLYQERELKDRNWAPFAVPPASLEALLLTHAHLDHCGFLPRLVRDGFHNPVYCTAATAEIAKITLLDSAHLLEEDAEFKRRRHEREGRKGPFPEVPLYTAEDAQAAFPLLKPVKYNQPVKLDGNSDATFYDAGHVLGSSMIKVRIRYNSEVRTIVFSGDIGGWDTYVLKDPTKFTNSDYILIESTYGDRLHEDIDIEGELAEIVTSTVKAGGNIIIPSFALERAQRVLYLLNKLLIENRIPHLMVFLDSPMAVDITQVYAHYPELFDKEMLNYVNNKHSPFDFPGLSLIRTTDQSKAINYIKGSSIIIAGSGMCTGGRIKHHLVTNISRPESTILFVGYQAEGTLGRQIVDGAREVRILGQSYPVRARIVQMNGLSAHSDRNGLLRWLSGFQKAPRRLFVVHGEPSAAESFARLVKEKTNWEVSVPNYRDSFILD